MRQFKLLSIMIDLVSELTSNGIPDCLARDLVSNYVGVKRSFYARNVDKLHNHAAKFCETIFQVLEFIVTGTYPKKATIATTVKLLESTKRDDFPQSIRVVVPRLANALYTIRSERGIPHKSDEVNPNEIDTAVTVALCNWLMAEFLRLYHTKDVAAINGLLRELTRKGYPIIEEFEDGGVILHVPNASTKELILAALYASSERLTRSEIHKRIRTKYRQLVDTALVSLNKKNFVDINETGVKISSTGISHLETLIAAPATTKEK